jgi:hypothetical protein
MRCSTVVAPMRAGRRFDAAASTAAAIWRAWYSKARRSITSWNAHTPAAGVVRYGDEWLWVDMRTSSA